MAAILTQVTPPAVEPVSLATAKQHLRVLHASEDALIERLIRTARQHLDGLGAASGILGRALCRQTLRLTLPRCPAGRLAVVLPRPPLVAVTGIAYVDAAGAAQSIPLGDVQVDGGADRPSVRPVDGKAWPAGTALAITYTAGYDPVPEPLVAAVLLLVQHWYDNRSAAGAAQQPLPFAVDALLAPYMTHGWI